MIQVKTGFEGANPGQAGLVEWIGENALRIQPYSEDGDGNYKFQMLVRLRNTAKQAATVDLTIDWDDLTYMGNRDYVLVGRTEKWRYFPVSIEAATAKASVVIPPGTQDVALQPTYGLDRLKAWRKRAGQGRPLTVRQVGQTSGGRPIEAFELGDPLAPPSQRVAILARCHPYETAGSFLAEGVLRELAAGAGRKYSHWRVSAVPMANPDGVAMGLCKRTSVGGCNLEQESASSEDATSQVLRQWLDEVRPAVLVDLHGWMHRYKDGFTYTHEDLAAQMKEQLLPVADIDRAWRLRIVGDHDTGSPWAYCRQRHGTRSLVYSFGWFGRSTSHMRRIGAVLMVGLAQCRW
jgi:hypothetical protein